MNDQTVKVIRDLMELIEQYIVDAEEGDWGEGRSIDEIKQQGAMPRAYRDAQTYLDLCANRPSSDNVRENRLIRKIEQRDRIIDAVKKRAEQAEQALGRDLSNAIICRPEDVARMVRREVTNALCNVRMIPVLGVGSSDKIVEITTATVKERTRDN